MLFKLIWTKSTLYSCPSLSLRTKNDLHVRWVLNKLTVECTYLKITNKFGLLNHSQNRTKWLTATSNMHKWTHSWPSHMVEELQYLPFPTVQSTICWNVGFNIIHSKDKMPIMLLLFTKNIIISTENSNLNTQTKGWNTYPPAFMFQSTQIIINIYTMFLTIKNEWRLK